MLDTQKNLYTPERSAGGEYHTLSAFVLTSLLTACSALEKREPSQADSLTPPLIEEVVGPLSDRQVATLFKRVLDADPPRAQIQKLGPNLYFEQGGHLGLDIQDPENPRRLDITRENYLENMGWVVGYLRQLRIESNPVLSELRDRVLGGEADRIEQSVYKGIWFAPANNSLAFERAMVEFHIGDRPLGTISELRHVLARINSSDSPYISLGTNADGEEQLCSIADIKEQLLRNPRMYLTLTRTAPDGAKEEIEYNAARVREDEERFDAAIFSLRVRSNPVLADLATRRERGEVSGAELAAYQAVMKHPTDRGKAYQEAEKYLRKLEESFPERAVKDPP